MLKNKKKKLIEISDFLSIFNELLRSGIEDILDYDN